jgi:hypothetical protein
MGLQKARLAWVELYAKTSDAGLVCQHRQLNAFTCSSRCLGPERATHFQ